MKIYQILVYDMSGIISCDIHFDKDEALARELAKKKFWRGCLDRGLVCVEMQTILLSENLFEHGSK